MKLLAPARWSGRGVSAWLFGTAVTFTSQPSWSQDAPEPPPPGGATPVATTSEALPVAGDSSAKARPAPTAAPGEDAAGSPGAAAVPDAAESRSRSVTRQCIDDHARAQEARLNGRLLEAGNLFERCTVASCPAMIRADCEQWGEEVQDELPLLLLKLPDNVVADYVQLYVNDQLVTATFDTPMVFEPGTFTLRVQAPGGRVYKEEVTLRAGEAMVVVNVELPPPAPSVLAPPPPPLAPAAPPPPDPWSTVPVLTWVFGGVAVASFGVATGFGVVGLSEYSELQDACAPLCGAEETAAVHDKLLVADVSLALGIASTTAAVVFYLLEQERLSDEMGARIAVGPNSATVGWGGSF